MCVACQQEREDGPACNQCGHEHDPTRCPLCDAEGAYEEESRILTQWVEEQDGPIPAVPTQGMQAVIQSYQTLGRDEAGVASHLEREAAFRTYGISDEQDRAMLGRLWDEMQQAFAREKLRLSQQLKKQQRSGQRRQPGAPPAGG